MNIIPVVEVSGNVGRETGRKKRTGFIEPEIAPGVVWQALCAKPDETRGEGCWVCDEGPLNTQLLSSALQLQKGQLYTFELQVEVDHAAPLALVLIKDEHQGSAGNSNHWLRHRAMEQTGKQRLAFSYAPEASGDYRLAMINYYGTYPRGSTFRLEALEILAAPYVADDSILDVDTYLPSWGPLKRYIHRRCKSSRLFNAFVAGMEMRLNREESLSLPMYLALCPTGQCNALCEFCSVTIKRTGIIKKQLPFDKVQRFIAPTLNTAYMYGVEGNGEPTLYREFNSLLVTLQKKGASSYLITNGALIEPEQIPHLLSLQSITFSLNAATAATHREVMKIKEFDRVTNSIRAIVDQRAWSDSPSVFVSFVVHATNVHELQQFLQFAEYDLRVNVIMIRPLSELGADLGAVEDLRDIVPYESQVNDALDAVREYLGDVPRRRIPYTINDCDIRIDPTTFRSVRPDPVDRVIMPPGFEGRLLAPRRDDWHVSSADMSVSWNLNRALVRSPQGSAGEYTWRSASTPVEPGKQLLFKANVTLQDAPLQLSVLAESGRVLASRVIQPGAGEQAVELAFETGEELQVSLVFAAAGAFVADIDFIRVMRPGAGIRKAFKLPFPRRWQIDSPGVRARWEGHALNIEAVPNLNGRYLIKSYSNPCAPGDHLSFPVRVEVTSGKLVIGVLSEDFQKWTHQFAFGPGSHAQDLLIDTAENHRLQVVLFARGDESLSARIDWGDALEQAPDREREGELIEMEAVAGDVPAASSPTTATPGKAKLIKVKQVPEKVRFYCQKPWTDINNFTVDGRMDVCCITTGPSQEHYALGNIFEQDFQSIWNGEKMREFRRTVNSDTPLPPCQRCPMAYGYQGPFFDRTLADASIASFVMTNRLPGRGPLQRVVATLADAVRKPLVELLFRGFKR
ncbi:radical SAM/SPASM domain-containing protein [Pseudomonas asplenii]|uniref:radical SAM/SPASM domain-containing protein n=1 Tax=Pseudomonas asplenii TaxID=53407 RepID=UPI000376D0B7|nr:radical SAM/SPASM domain-containing protein [Pseudomonas fuscovaginae]